MTNTTDMPDTIWAHEDRIPKGPGERTGGWVDHGPGDHTETLYTRSDLAPTREQIEALVKPLEWEYHPAGKMAADNIGSSYIIDTRGSGPAVFIKWPRGFAPKSNTLAGAKAAAQADYTNRILSALGLEPNPPQGGE